MFEYLEEIIDLGSDLEQHYPLEWYEEHVEDVYQDIIAKSQLFFQKLEDDPLKLKLELEHIKTDSFDVVELGELLKILKKARNYFDIIETQELGVWETMHPLINHLCKKKFNNGFYADAVETALKEVNNIIKIEYKAISGEELDGARLMQKVFSVNNPVFQFADITTETGRNIQQGYMNIFTGSMIGIRNPKAHNNMNPDKTKAIHLLQIASFLILKIDEMGLIKKTPANNV